LGTKYLFDYDGRREKRIRRIPIMEGSEEEIRGRKETRTGRGGETKGTCGTATRS
jgi:hypothetical protein